MSKITAEVRRLLKSAGVKQIQLTKAGIGVASARRLLDKPGEEGKPVGIDTIERALSVLGRELTTRRKR